MPDGKFEEMDVASDSALYLPAGTHTPANVGSTPIDGILVEFKAAAPGKVTLPASRPEMTLKLLAEGPRAAAYRVASSPAFAEPAGSTHDFDQVVIAIAPLQLSLAMDGKPARTTWARGDVVFIPRGVPHEAKNTGKTPGGTINVLIK